MSKRGKKEGKKERKTNKKEKEKGEKSLTIDQNQKAKNPQNS